MRVSVWPIAALPSYLRNVRCLTHHRHPLTPIECRFSPTHRPLTGTHLANWKERSFQLPSLSTWGFVFPFEDLAVGLRFDGAWPQQTELDA
jgi:hypothetical protein